MIFMIFFSHKRFFGLEENFKMVCIIFKRGHNENRNREFYYRKCSAASLAVASHAGLLLRARHALVTQSYPTNVGEERLRDEPKECLRGRLVLQQSRSDRREYS